MMLRSNVIVAVLAALLVCSSLWGQAARYDGHAVIRAEVATVRDFQAMLAIGARPWSCRIGIGPGVWAASPEQLEAVGEAGIGFEILIEDVQALIDAERQQIDALRQAGGAAGPGGAAGEDFFAVYRTWEEVNAYIDELVALHPDLIEKLFVGTSHEGREIYGMRIAAPGSVSGERPAVLFNGCQHAREWISVMVPMYIADRLVRDHDVDAEIQALLDEVEVFIVPIVNPDGYVFSHDLEEGDRMWRKNRRDNLDGTFGVDLNRNWEVDWSGGGSTSTNTASDIYVGPYAMSEPEVQAMRDFILERPQIVAHIDFHNFSEIILLPLAHSLDPVPDFGLVNSLGQLMSSAIESVHGVPYPAGLAGNLLYLASGVFPDWSYAEQGVFGYTVELRPSTFDPGFLLPPEEILPTSEEAFAGAMAMSEWAAEPAWLWLPQPLPEIVEAGEVAPVTVGVSHLSGPPLVEGSATVSVRIGESGGFVDIPLTAQGEGVWGEFLPAAECGDVIEFYFSIENEIGETFTSPANAPQALHEIDVVQTELIFADDFEQDLGWTVGAPDDDAITGIWELADPVGTSVSGQPVQPDAPFIGAMCYITGQHPGGNAGANDVDEGKTTLFSPVFDVSVYDDAIIGYWRWYSNHAGANAFNDVFEVDVSNDGGKTWVNAETVGPAGPEVVGGWFHHEFRLGDFVSVSAEVQVRFVASDYDPQALVEAAVDSFRLRGVACDETPVCPGDLTGDGTVGVDDLLLLLAAWGDCADCTPGNCHADLTGNCTVEVDDLLILLANWG